MMEEDRARAAAEGRAEGRTEGQAAEARRFLRLLLRKHFPELESLAEIDGISNCRCTGVHRRVHPRRGQRRPGSRGYPDSGPIKLSSLASRQRNDSTLTSVRVQSTTQSGEIAKRLQTPSSIPLAL